MTKKFFMLATLIFLLFASPPLIIAIYQGQLKDIMVISLIIIIVFSITTYEFIRRKN
ncbi:hypothetical protein OKW24_000955 [Peribacillus simplex]|nr:hypothetical protein [Peribacillus simplex]